jgi:glycosyltransferase involved in cell wall biosynthesis
MVYPKKILLIIDNLGSGGAQNQLTFLAKELKNVGLEISVFTYYPQDFFKERLIKANIEHIHIQKRGKLGFNVVKGLIKLINKEKYHTVFSVLDTPNFYTCVAAKLASHKSKVIISYLSKSKFDEMSWFEKKRKEWTNKVANHIIANSHHERERWLALYPKLKNKFSTIYNIIDFDKYYVSKNKMSSSKYLVIGSPSQHKNGLCLITAMKKLKEQGILIYVDWYGQKVFSLNDRKTYIEQMESLILEYKLTEQWMWYEPTIKIEDVYQKYKALILPSVVEGLPNVICEALASGLPVLASNILDHPMLLDYGKNGFLFDPYKPEELANELKKFENLSQEKISEISKNARSYSEKTFDIETIIPQNVELLK